MEKFLSAVCLCTVQSESATRTRCHYSLVLTSDRKTALLKPIVSPPAILWGEPEGKCDRRTRSQESHDRQEDQESQESQDDHIGQ